MSEILKSPICEITPCGAGKRVEEPVVGKTYRVVFADIECDIIGCFLAEYKSVDALEYGWDWYITDPTYPDLQKDIYAHSVYEAIDNDSRPLEVS